MKRLVFAAVLGVALVGAAVLRGEDIEIARREKLRSIIGTNGLVVATSAATITTNKLHTPAYRGQFLFGGAGEGTNGVWVAKGVTTNDWVQIAP